MKLIQFSVGLASAALATLAAASGALAQFVVTIEAPGVQSSQLANDPAAFGATDVEEETFDSLPAGINTPIPFTSVGSYDSGLVVSADVFGGAGGVGQYLTVNTNLGSPATTTLALSNPKRYFGLFYSAGDSQNVLEFFNNGTLIDTFTTADVIDFVNAQPNASQYFGNPNGGGNGGEPYAFLNFFANPGVTFNEIRFSNGAGSGFESDNHTLATDFTSISGTPINPVPEPSTVLATAAVLAGGAALKRKQQARQSADS
jgi:hypothetical protein